MRSLFVSALLTSALAAQTTLPPGALSQEGFASDGNVWTYQTFRAATRYPASWVMGPRTVTQVAWRADAPYAWTYDRLQGQATVRAGAWLGSTAVVWSTNLTTVFQGALDPPQMVVVQAWTPQPFTFVVPFSAPLVIPQGGLEVDIAFVGPWDPVWGNRATYWVDALQSPDSSPTLADQWLDQVPPHLGCAGWVSEARADRVQGKLTMEARDTGLPNAPAVLVIGTVPSILGCSHVAGTVFLQAVTDSGAWLQYHFSQPVADFTWVWQAWIFDSTRPIDQCLGSGHYCAWRYGDPWPCQEVYAYDAAAALPSYSVLGSAWAVRIQ